MTLTSRACDSTTAGAITADEIPYPSIFIGPDAYSLKEMGLIIGGPSV